MWWDPSLWQARTPERRGRRPVTSSFGGFLLITFQIFRNEEKEHFLKSKPHSN